MDPLTFKILVFIIWFLVPAIPAVIIFKLIPDNKVFVKGPFQGLKINLTGAFGGYFLLILISYLMVKEMIFEKQPDVEVWTLKGFVKDDRAIPLDCDKHQASVTLYPEHKIANGDLNFPVLVNYLNNGYDFPRISISGFSNDETKANLYLAEDQTRELNDPDPNGKEKRKGHWVYDYKKRIITYDTAIIMKKELPAVAENTANTILTVDTTGGHLISRDL